MGPYCSEAIETTEAKAKAVRGLIDQLVTFARKGTLASTRQIEKVVADKDLVHKLVHEIAPVLNPALVATPGSLKPAAVLVIMPLVRMEFVK